jgi:hypothetical protein
MTAENRALDRAYRPHLDCSQSPGDLPFEGRDGNFKVLSRTGTHHLHRNYLVEKFLKYMM